MIRGLTLAGLVLVVLSVAPDADAQQAYNRHWARTYNTMDWMRYYHYPYVYYPHNFWNADYFQSGESLYNRYPSEMQIPVYNKQWHNYYPEQRRYHYGKQFILDVF